jgi:ankyrin repeat protein
MVARRMAAVLGLGVAIAAQHAAAQFSESDVYTIPMAAARNDTALVQSLLEDPLKDPNLIESFGGRTALDYAASFNNAQMATMLLSHNAHVDARDKEGNTALGYAAERGNLDLMRILLDAKANPNAANRDGMTPLMLAADKTQTEAVRMLLAHGADPKKQDFTGRDAFGWAAGKPAVLTALHNGGHSNP